MKYVLFVRIRPEHMFTACHTVQGTFHSKCNMADLQRQVTAMTVSTWLPQNCLENSSFLGKCLIILQVQMSFILRDLF